MGWTQAQFEAYNKRMRGTQLTQGGSRTPAAGAKKRNAPTGDAPLSVEAAYQIYQVKVALARDACKVADTAWAVYEAIWARADAGPM